GPVVPVRDHVPTGPVVTGLEATDFAQRADLRALVLGPRQVVQIERVLGPEIAADVALAAERAGAAGASVQVRRLFLQHVARHGLPTGAAEADGERRQLPIEAEPGGRRLHGVRLRGAVVGRVVERVRL